MKRTLARFVLPMVLLSVTAFAQTGSAAPATPASAPAGTKIGIINIAQAIQLTNEGRRDLEALDKKFEPQRNSLQTLQKEVQDGEKQLQTQSDKLNDDARAKLARDLDTKKKTMQRQLEDAQQDYQQQQGEVVNRIGSKLMEVLDKYAKEHGYSVIIDVSQQTSPVLWASAGSDVTKEIADAYNVASGIPAPASTPAAPSAVRPPSAANRPPVTGTKPASTPK